MFLFILTTIISWYNIAHFKFLLLFDLDNYFNSKLYTNFKIIIYNYIEKKNKVWEDYTYNQYKKKYGMEINKRIWLIGWDVQRPLSEKDQYYDYNSLIIKYLKEIFAWSGWYGKDRIMYVYAKDDWWISKYLKEKLFPNVNINVINKKDTLWKRLESWEIYINKNNIKKYDKGKDEYLKSKYLHIKNLQLKSCKYNTKFIDQHKTHAAPLINPINAYYKRLYKYIRELNKPN